MLIILLWLAGSIEGRLWNPVSGAPVRKADVVVGTVAGVQIKRVLSDLDGRYVVSGLAAGRYRVAAGRAGFVPTLAPFLIVLRADETRKDVNLAMSVPAAISGRVLDREGEPVEGTTVTALLLGTGKVSLAGSSQTDDQGRYRIAGLTAGRFLLRAARGVAAAEGGVEQLYAPAYYPAVDEVGSADAVNVALGGDARDLEIHVKKVPAVLLSGTVRGLLGQQVVRVRVARRSTGAVMSAVPDGEVTALPDGRFAFQNLAPGAYVLSANATGADGAEYWGRRDVRLDSGSAESELTLEAGFELQAESNEAIRASLVRVNGQRSQANGKLLFRNITPGTWELQVSPIAEGHFVESVMWGEQEVLGKPFEIGQGRLPKLRVRVSDQAGTLEGEGGLVSLAPENGGPALEAVPGEDGHYRIRGIRPGKYRLLCTGEVFEIGAGALVKRDCPQ